jgi:hypothetical protein
MEDEMSKKRTPWQRIRDAYERGTGCRLSSDDCEQLGMDDAIMTRADLDDDGSQETDAAKDYLEPIP